MEVMVDFFNRLAPAEKLFVCFALFFLIGAWLFIVFLVISRTLKNSRGLQELDYRQKFQQVINDIIFIDTPSDLALSADLENLRTSVGHSPQAKQVLIDHLIRLKKNLAGIAAQNLGSTFRLLQLFDFSLQKIQDVRWEKKAQGIYELGEMDYVEAKEKIQTFLISKNRTLQEEAFTALLKLEKDASMSFLDDYPGALSHWMRLRIHHYLSHSDKRNLPDFSRWFLSPNTDVALFALSMAQQFRQLSAAPQLVALLRDPDRRKASLAVTALGELEAYEHAITLVSIIDVYWNDSPLSLCIARSLGRIGNTAEHWQAVARYLLHVDYPVRFASALALHQSGQGLLLNEYAINNSAMTALIRHVEEPLLQPT